MSLTREQKLIAITLRNRYLAIFIKWAENPTNFEHNIACLGNLRGVVASFTEMLRPYFNQSFETTDHPGFFSEMESMSQLKKAYKIADEIKKIFFSDETNNHIREIFKKEPRITGISADINEQHNETIKGSIRDNNVDTFEIKFSDNSKLTLHSLDDQKALAEAKEFFEHKLQALDMNNRRELRMN